MAWLLSLRGLVALHQSILSRNQPSVAPRPCKFEGFLAFAAAPSFVVVDLHYGAKPHFARAWHDPLTLLTRNRDYLSLSGLQACRLLLGPRGDDIAPCQATISAVELVESCSRPLLFSSPGVSTSW